LLWYVNFVFVSTILFLLAATRVPLPTLFGIKFYQSIFCFEIFIFILLCFISMRFKVLFGHFYIQSPESGVTLCNAELHPTICISSLDEDIGGVETCVLCNDRCWFHSKTVVLTAVWLPFDLTSLKRLDRYHNISQTRELLTSATRHNCTASLRIQFCLNWESCLWVVDKPRPVVNHCPNLHWSSRHFFLDCLILDHKGNRFLRNVRNHSSKRHVVELPLAINWNLDCRTCRTLITVIRTRPWAYTQTWLIWSCAPDCNLNQQWAVQAVLLSNSAL
jgi:hypothetical protein